MLYNCALLFHEALNIPVKGVLTNDCRVFYRRPTPHPYELRRGAQRHRALGDNGPLTADHWLCHAHAPHTLDERVGIRGREKWYESLDET